MKFFFRIFLFIIITAGPAYACKCVETDSVQHAFRKTANIFHGRVLSKRLVPFSETVKSTKVDSIRSLLKADKQKLDLFDLDYIYKIEFEVLEDFKGTRTGTRVIVYTAMQSVSCGFHFEKDKAYIVYGLPHSYMKLVFLSEPEGSTGIEKAGTWWTSTCMRTRAYQNGEAVQLRALKKAIH